MSTSDCSEFTETHKMLHKIKCIKVLLLTDFLTEFLNVAGAFWFGIQHLVQTALIRHLAPSYD